MARVRLGELLLLRGVCSREQLREAWEQKVLYGDRLGTNLLALGIDEAAIANALGVQHGVHGAHGANLCVEAAAVALLPAATAVKRQALPHSVVDGTLYLLMVDPENLRAVDEARFATSLRVQPVVVCEARMWTLLSQHHGARAPMRPNPLDVMRRPVATASVAVAAIADEDRGDLVSEEDFNDLYARLAEKPVDLGFGLPGEVAETFDLVDAVTSDDERDNSIPDLAPLHIPEVVAEPSAPVAAWSMPALRAQVRSVGLMEIELVEALDDVDSGSPFSMPPTNTSQPLQTVDWSPLRFDEASERLKIVSSRDDIGRVVLRAARTHFARACLLTVYPQAFVGWLGVGEGFEAIADVVVRRDAPSVFKLVADSRAHYLGPLQRFAAHGAWVKATGKRIPRSLVVMPILVRGRAVNLLVADNGHDEHVGSDVGELLILAQQIAASYESLIGRG